MPSQFNPTAARTTLLTGSRLWIAIAVVAIVVFCTSCLCLFYAVQRAVQ